MLMSSRNDDIITAERASASRASTFNMLCTHQVSACGILAMTPRCAVIANRHIELRHRTRTLQKHLSLSLLSALPMFQVFVPSLSWQNDQFDTQKWTKWPVFAHGSRSIGGRIELGDFDLVSIRPRVRREGRGLPALAVVIAVADRGASGGPAVHRHDQPAG